MPKSRQPAAPLRSVDAPSSLSSGGRTLTLMQRWADGKATLKDVRGYSDEELFTLTKLAYFYFYQGRLDEARTLFQGLYAVNPTDAYVARALGVVELAAGNPTVALQAYDVAVKLAPEDPAAYVGRAEVQLSLGQKLPALEDLRRALQVARVDQPLKAKISGMLAALQKK